MNDGQHECETHGRVQAIERPGEKPICPLCKKEVVLRLKWLRRVW